MSGILNRVNTPADLKHLNLDELATLAGELRKCIIETVSQTGGHLAANLGVIELTLALLRTFEPPRDRVVWDVSHQTYAWKLLTGRRDRFRTLRQYGGISGFLRRDESDCDAFGAGHSGTAMSAALGMAVARDRAGGTEHVVAVVGDGALGCGISFEALNNVSHTTQRLIVILNDNEWSIAANVGAVSRSLGRLLASAKYNRWKRSVEGVVVRSIGGRLANWVRKAYYRTEEALKGVFLRSVIFEEFGLRYIGPIDGHDIRALLEAMEIARTSERPILLHVWTQKGRGYPLAEKHPEQWHGTSPFDIETGRPLCTSSQPTYSQVFGQTLEQMAVRNPQVVAITAAMSSGTGLSHFARRFPERFFDIGISEEHGLVFAAGLATSGFQPFYVLYSTFFQRAVDFLIHDVCLQKLPVVVCLDRAGVVGDDGPTHHGVFDIALLRSVPNLVFMQPKDTAELSHMLYSAGQWCQPTVIRYPRGCGPKTPLPETLEEIPFGRAEGVREGWQIQFWVLGDMLPLAWEAAEILNRKGLSAGVVNARFVCPLDRDLVLSQSRYAQVFLTLENGVVDGGFGSAVEEVLVAAGYKGRVIRCGWPNEFVPQGPPEILMRDAGLTVETLVGKVLAALA